MTTSAVLPHLFMASDIEFELTGDVSLADFDLAIKALHTLLEGLAKEVADGASIRWLIEDLRGGSATAVLAPEIDTPDSDRIIKAYGEVGEALEHNEPLPYQSAKKPAKVLRKIIKGPVESVIFKTRDLTATLEDIQAKELAGPSYAESYGAVIGFLRSLSIPARQGLQGSVRDEQGRSVRCYFDEGHEDQLRELWGEHVAVEGRVRRQISTGRTVSVSRITNVEKREVVAPGAWREAEGIAPDPEGGPSSEDAVRRVRDR